MKLHSSPSSTEDSGDNTGLGLCSVIASASTACLKNHRTCPKCGRQVSTGSFAAHRDSCRGK